MVNGVGLGFRRDLTNNLLELKDDPLKPSFVECAPENWIQVGGKWGKKLREITEQYPLTCHGLSLSIGGPDPLNMEYLALIKAFLEEHNVDIYSEHLSYSSVDNAHLHELLPIPFRQDAISHIAERIKTVQEFLGRKIAIENVSYYTPVAAEMDEATFINAILEEADCELLLDVNNIFVNAFNHNYDPEEFLNKLDLSRVRYIHMAGHEQRTPELIVDTHGNPIIPDVFKLFDLSCSLINKPVPVLLERDFNFSDFEGIKEEIATLRDISNSSWEQQHVA